MFFQEWRYVLKNKQKLEGGPRWVLKGCQTLQQPFPVIISCPPFPAHLLMCLRGVVCGATQLRRQAAVEKHLDAPRPILGRFRIAIAQNADPINQIYGILFSP